MKPGRQEVEDHERCHVPFRNWCAQFGWQRLPDRLEAFTDSDFAGCSKTRKSTTGRCVMWGDHCLKGLPKTQAIIALSSGEADLAALVKGFVELMGMRSIMRDFSCKLILGLATDATAAIGMVAREGLGKVRHLAVADQWVQERQRLGDIDYKKVDGPDNPANALTKCVDGETLRRHMGHMGFIQSSGRHRLGPQLINDNK